MDDYLQRVVDSLDVSPERFVNLIQWEVVSNNAVSYTHLTLPTIYSV